MHATIEIGNSDLNLQGSGKLINTMANVSIFFGNFFHFAKTKKYAFQMMVNNF